MILKSNGGLLVKFETNSFSKAIIKLINDTKKAKELGINGYNWVIKNRSYEKMAHDVEKIYQQLLE